MKRLLILTAAAVVTASASGCWHWCNRGGSCQTSPCGTPGTTYAADPYMAPAGPPPTTTIVPGATYVPGPQG
jgi:hypothetical protein